MEELELYVIRNKNGQYFRAKGYGGYGPSWVEELKKARIYTKLGPPRSQVTWWANNYPDYGVPEIVVLTVSALKVLNEEERVKKAIIKSKTETINRELYYAKQKEKEAQKRVQQLSDKKAYILAQSNVKKLEEQLKNLKK